MVQASADYSIGFLDIRELSDAVEAYVDAAERVLKARFDHNVAMAALSKATVTLDDDTRSLLPGARPEVTYTPGCGGAA